VRESPSKRDPLRRLSDTPANAELPVVVLDSRLDDDFERLVEGVNDLFVVSRRSDDTDEKAIPHRRSERSLRE